MKFIATSIKWLLAALSACIIIWSFWHVAQRVLTQSNRQGDIVLTVLHWGIPEEDRIVESLVHEFESTHPAVRISRINASDYDPKLRTMFAAGTPPDVFYLPAENVPEFVGANLLYDLTPLIQEEKRATGAARG